MILEQNPQRHGIHYRLGRLFLTKTPPDLENAKKEFGEELKIDPTSAASEFLLGEIARQSGEWDDAIGHFEKAAKLDEGFIEAYLAMGMSMNSPDMLEVGNGGMNHDEYITHMSLWVLLAAPLLAGNDLSKMKQETQDILTNKEVLAVDQDAKGVQGRRVAQAGPLEVWAKPLADGSVAVGLFNRGESTNPVTVNFKDVGTQSSAHLRDLWQHKDLGSFTASYTGDVPRHGAILLKIQ